MWDAKRFLEAAAQSAAAFTYRYTDFLSPSEAAEGLKAAREVSGRNAAYTGNVRAFGGAEGCERVMLRFGDPEEFGYEEPFPIRIVRARTPGKFSDELTHRDYLGALMNLGIRRDTVGDIRLDGNDAWIFAEEAVAPFIVENLTRVKHTAVRCVIEEALPDDVLPKREPVSVNAASPRLDGILAHLLHQSRGKTKELFAQHAVLLNGYECTSESEVPKENDVIVVRGYGKFLYRGVTGRTRKGGVVMELERYL